MIDKKNWGVLYFLTPKVGTSIERVLNVHGKLLLKSLDSLKVHMPDIEAVLFTSMDVGVWADKGFDKVIYKENVVQDVWTYKYECMLDTPFERTIHMDCDTYVCDSFYEVFEMLDGVDFAAPFSPWYFGKRIFHVPRAFPELAGGFIAYNTNRRTFDMLEEAKGLVMSRDGGCDEPYLRVALYESKVKFSVLPWEYNCVFLLPGILMNKAKVLHGKTNDIDPVKRCLTGDGPKLFTGEKVIYCNRISRKKYKMGLVEFCGHNKAGKDK